MPDQSPTLTLSLLQCPECAAKAVRPGRTGRDNGHISVDFACASCGFAWTSMRPERGRWKSVLEPVSAAKPVPAARLLGKAG
jgi:predicted RNA-binding Zn-ribbon protein involved in translation (DUF1610 family)